MPRNNELTMNRTGFALGVDFSVPFMQPDESIDLSLPEPDIADVFIDTFDERLSYSFDPYQEPPAATPEIIEVPSSLQKQRMEAEPMQEFLDPKAALDRTNANMGAMRPSGMTNDDWAESYGPPLPPVATEVKAPAPVRPAQVQEPAVSQEPVGVPSAQHVTVNAPGAKSDTPRTPDPVTMKEFLDPKESLIRANQIMGQMRPPGMTNEDYKAEQKAKQDKEQKAEQPAQEQTQEQPSSGEPTAPESEPVDASADPVAKLTEKSNTLDIAEGTATNTTESRRRSQEEGSGSASGGGFSGVYWFKGQRYTLSGDAQTSWYHDEDSGSGSWSTDPVPSTMPSRQYWRDTASCGRVAFLP